MPQSGKPMTERDRLRAVAATHNWVGAVTIPLSASQARTGNLRAAVVLKSETRVQVLDAYCAGCKRNWEALVGVTCPVKDTRANEHLRGGPIGERKKRGPQARRQAAPVPENVAS